MLDNAGAAVDYRQVTVTSIPPRVDVATNSATLKIANLRQERLDATSGGIIRTRRMVLLEHG